MDGPPCDETDEPCRHMEVELMPENELAFEIFEIGRSGAIGNLNLELARMAFPELRDLNNEGAYLLLRKLRILASVTSEMEAEDLEAESQKAKKGRNG